MQALFLKSSVSQPDRYNSCFMKWIFGLCGLILMHIPIVLRAQLRTVIQNEQLWLGYMTSTKLNDTYSLWNDFHLVPEGFFVARTGLTFHAKDINVTTGYAFLLLPKSPIDPSLQRKEHRPWAQAVASFPLPRSFSWVQRIRYDARFRQNVVGTELIDGYTFTNRFRFLTAIKKMIGENNGRKFQPYVVVADEVLLNFGESVVNTFDQNRIQLSVGLQGKNIQYQFGYMSRLVQTGPTNYVNNHTLLFWVTQKLSFKGSHTKHEIIDVSPGE
jgi:hypothetical protein